MKQFIILFALVVSLFACDATAQPPKKSKSFFSAQTHSFATSSGSRYFSLNAVHESSNGNSTDPTAPYDSTIYYEIQAATLIPPEHSPTFSKLGVHFAEPIPSGSVTVTLVKNGVATGVSVTIAAGGTKAENTSSEEHCSPGDLVTWRITPSGSFTVPASTISVGVRQ